MSEESHIRSVGGIGLALFALFFGGCSAFFAYDELILGYSSGTYILWVPGLILGALFARSALRQLYPSKQPRTEQPTESGSANKPTPPPDP